MPISCTKSCSRKRSYPTSGFLVASAVAISFTCTASAFQNAILPLQSRPLIDNIPRQRTNLCVVTDPEQLVQIDFERDDNSDRRKTLEDIYLITTSDAAGLSGEILEGIPSRRNGSGKGKTQEKMQETPATSAATSKRVRSLPNQASSLPRTERIQFRGLSTTNGREKKQKSLSRTPPTPRSLQNERPVVSRSSTMPGFSSTHSDRHTAYMNGIKLAEQRSGKKFVDTAEAKKKRRQLNGEAMYKTSNAVPESMMQFANEIHEVERITPKDEVILGERTQEAIRLQNIFDGLVLKLEREPSDEEWCAAAGKINMEALSQAIEDGLEAKNTLVTANLRMVQGVVNVYIRNGLRGQYNAGDLMQEGIMALIRAAEKFDPSRGFRFSTYAMYWIRSAIKRDQIFQSRVVTVPQRLYENHKRILRVQRELKESLDRQPTMAEIGKAVGMSEVQIERCLSAMSQRCYSLDQQVSNPLKPLTADSDSDTMYELIESRTDDGDYNKQNHSFLREDLIATLRQHLSEEEAELLLLRYGLMDSVPQNLKNGPLTIAEVSRMVGLKPDKVRRMINRSLKHMKAVIGSEWIEYERELQ